MLRHHSRQGVSQAFSGFFPRVLAAWRMHFVLLWGCWKCWGGKAFWESSSRATWTLSPGGTHLPCPGRAACSVGFLDLLSTLEGPKLVSVNTTAPKVSQPDLLCHCISHIMSFVCSKLGPDSSSPFTKHTWTFFSHSYFHCDPRLGGLLITIIFGQRFF